MTDLCAVEPSYTVTFKRRSKQPAERVWRAITEPDEVSAWMDYRAKVDLRPGGEWHVDFSRKISGVVGDESDDNLDGVIVRMEPGRQLAIAWGFTSPERSWSVFEWVIEPAADGSLYTFAQYGVAPRAMEREGVAWGWHAFLDQLDGHMDGEFADGRFRRFATATEQIAFYDDELKAVYRRHLDAALGR